MCIFSLCSWFDPQDTWSDSFDDQHEASLHISVACTTQFVDTCILALGKKQAMMSSEL